MKNKLLSLILKEKLIISIGLISSLALFICYCLFFYTPLYSTTASLLVRNIPKQDVVATYGGGSIVKSESGYSNPLFNLIKLLESERLSDRVYKILESNYKQDALTLDIKSKEDWYKVYSKLTLTKVEPSTDVIKVTFKWINKENAADLLNHTVKEFKKENMLIRKNVEIKNSKYLNEQLQIIGQKLDNIRKQIRDYKLANNAIDVNNEVTELTKARVELEKRLELLKGDLSYYSRKLADYSYQLDFPDGKTVLRSTAVGGDPYLIDLTQELASAQQNYARLIANYTPNFPEVLAAKNEVESLKKDIKARREQSLQNIKIKRGLYDRPSLDIATDLARAQAEKAALTSQLIAINKGINNLKSKEAKLPSKILGLEELQKEETALIDAYNNIRQKQIEAKIKENEIVDNIVVLNSPSKPTFLFIPLLLKFISFILVGFMASLGIAWVKEDIEDKWNSSEEIEFVTGKSILGVIPWIKEEEFKSSGVIHSPNTIMGIAFGNVASNIIRKSYLEDAQVISFISTVSSRSQSLLSLNLCSTFARLNRSVILIDTDFTNPAKLLKKLNLSGSMMQMDLVDTIDELNKHIRLAKNVEDVTVDSLLKNAVVPVNIQLKDGSMLRFSYLCANKIVANIHNYVATQGYIRLLEFLKNHYELILVDTPSRPFVFPEFSAITNSSDAVAIFSSLNINRHSLISMIKKLEQNNVNVLGIIPREENSEIERYFAEEISVKPNVKNLSNRVGTKG